MSRVRKTRIFNYLKEHPMASAKEVMGAVGCSAAAVCYTRQKMGIPSTILGRRKKYGTATPTSAPQMETQEDVTIKAPTEEENVFKFVHEMLEENAQIISTQRTALIKLQGVIDFLEEKLVEAGVGFR